jgi:hypothetical protein
MRNLNKIYNSIPSKYKHVFLSSHLDWPLCVFSWRVAMIDQATERRTAKEAANKVDVPEVEQEGHSHKEPGLCHVYASTVSLCLSLLKPSIAPLHDHEQQLSLLTTR